MHHILYNIIFILIIIVNRTIPANVNKNNKQINIKEGNKIKINTNTQIFKTIKLISDINNLNNKNKTKKLLKIN